MVGIWQVGSAAFFVYLALVTALPRGLTGEDKRRVWRGAALGLGLLTISMALAPAGVANAWILPPLVLLTAYRASGFLFVHPMPRAERLLADGDAALRIDRLASRAPRAVAELLEIAYTGVYPVVPIALFLARRQGVDVDRFWTVVLFTDFICFAMLPWIQTRTPRAVMPIRPWRSSWRVVNLRIVETGSIGVNTFPSGHAAEGLAAALLVSGGPWPIGLGMFAAAAAIAAGAVLGRYHYAADAVAGWAVALIVWAIV
jgi:membrane-associated phospholipid phosphatase